MYKGLMNSCLHYFSLSRKECHSGGLVVVPVMILPAVLVGCCVDGHGVLVRVCFSVEEDIMYCVCTTMYFELDLVILACHVMS